MPRTIVLKSLMAPFLAAAALAAQTNSTAASAQAGFSHMNTILREQPQREAAALARVRPGAQLTLYGCLRQQHWCKVLVDGRLGWVRSNVIAVMLDGRYEILSDTGGPAALSALPSANVGPVLTVSEVLDRDVASTQSPGEQAARPARRSATNVPKAAAPLDLRAVLER